MVHSTRSDFYKNLSLKRFRHSTKRKKIKKKRLENYHKHFLTLLNNAKKKQISFQVPPRHLELKEIIRRTTKPQFSSTIEFLAREQKSFSKESVKIPDDGIFEVPEVFSLIENPKESFTFLKQLFYALYNDKLESIILDYKDCKRIDLDSSICTDILLKEFIAYFNVCRVKSYFVKTKSIGPRNIANQNVRKTLFSIGAYPILRNII